MANYYEKCLWVPCSHRPWARTVAELHQMLKDQGWGHTSVGWICPEHRRMAKALGEIATGKVNISA